jgi:CHAD domain-containing protein
MMKQFVRDYLLEQKKKFVVNYKAAIKTQDIDAVHDMRVAVKRLNTTIRMLNFNEKANFRLKKSFIPVRFVYKQFGGIRDFQVLLALVKEFQEKMELDLNAIIDYCKERIEYEISELSNSIKLFEYHTILRNFKLIEKYIENKTHDDLSVKVLNYKANRIEKMKFYADKSNVKRNLHEVRKMIKDISYLMEMSTEVLPDFSKELKLYKDLGSLLGTWHDRAVLLNYLRLYQRNNKNTNLDFSALLKKSPKKNLSWKISFTP